MLALYNCMIDKSLFVCLENEDETEFYTARRFETIQNMLFSGVIMEGKCA